MFMNSAFVTYGFQFAIMSALGIEIERLLDFKQVAY